MGKRALHQEEKQLLEITKRFHQKRSDSPFNWSKLGLWVGIEIICLLIILYFDNSWISLLPKIVLGLIPIGLWIWIKGIISDKKVSRGLLKRIESIQTEGNIEVRSFSCNRAIKFGDPEDIGTCFALEIGENQLLFWWNSYEEESILPNTTFEVYQGDDTMYSTTGRRLTVSGARFQPISISGEISREIWQDLPDHGTIIEADVDSYLAKISNILK